MVKITLQSLLSFLNFNTMQIVKEKMILGKLKQIAQKGFGNLVKAVVDVEKGIMAIDAELHSDEEALLISDGSKQENLWGINLYPDLTGEEFIEFDSMINVRPSQNNPDRGVCDPKIRGKIISIVNSLIES